MINRATFDSGDIDKIFHNNVDGKKPLLLLIKTDRFGTIGVYTSIGLGALENEW